MVGQAELLDAMAVSWRALKRHVDGFDGDLNQPFDDVWTLRDAVLHIAVWERVAIRRITGAPLPVGESEARREPWDIDEFNDALLDLWSAVDNAGILNEFEEAHRSLVTAVSNSSNADCAPGGSVAMVIAQDGAGHYHLHFPVPNVIEPAFAAGGAETLD